MSRALHTGRCICVTIWHIAGLYFGHRALYLKHCITGSAFGTQNHRPCTSDTASQALHSGRGHPLAGAGRAVCQASCVSVHRAPRAYSCSHGFLYRGRPTCEYIQINIGQWIHTADVFPCVWVCFCSCLCMCTFSLSLYLGLYSSVSAYLVCLAVSVRLFLSLLLYVYKIVHVRACVYACLRARAPVIFLFRQLCFILKIRTYKHTKSSEKTTKCWMPRISFGEFHEIDAKNANSG